MNGITPFRQKILEDVELHPATSVNDIAERLDTTPQLIQVGLRWLWAANLLQRERQKHGRAWCFLYTAVTHV